MTDIPSLSRSEAADLLQAVENASQPAPQALSAEQVATLQALITRYRRPHVAMTADCIVFVVDGNQLSVLLIKRGIAPFEGELALPGGFMNVIKDENLLDTANRELEEETGITGIQFSLSGVYSAKQRDPRGRVVSGAFYTAIKPDELGVIQHGSDADSAQLYPVAKLGQLAFDHADIIQEAYQKLVARVHQDFLSVCQFLGPVFTVQDLRAAYNAIMLNPDDQMTLPAIRHQLNKCLKQNLVELTEHAEERSKPGKPNVYYRLTSKASTETVSLAPRSTGTDTQPTATPAPQPSTGLSREDIQQAVSEQMKTEIKSLLNNLGKLL